MIRKAFQRGSSGFIMPVVLFAILFVSALALQFFWMSRQSRSQSFRLGNSEVVRRLTESAMGEAYNVISRKLEKDEPTRNNLLNQVSSLWQVETPQTQAMAKSLYSSMEAGVQVHARCVDFRNSGPNKAPYFGKEGLGTIEIHAEGYLKQGERFLSSCKFVRHYDYKVAALATGQHDENRLGYTGGHYLDYLLHLRDGVREFESSSGFSLNLEGKHRIKLLNPGNRKGKIFLGSCSGKKPIFLNIFEDLKAMIPKVITPDLWQVGIDECLTLFPLVKRDVETELKKLPPGSTTTVKDVLKGLKGFFLLSHEPIEKPSYTTKEELVENANRSGVMLNLKKDFGDRNNPQISLSRGLDILQDTSPTYARDVLRGDIRQRFLYNVTFKVDFSQVEGITQTDVQKWEKDNLFPCIVPVPPPEVVNGQTTIEYFKGLETLAANNPGKKISSAFPSEYPYQSGLSGTPPAPSFQDPTLFGYRMGPSVRTDPMSNDLLPYQSYFSWLRSFQDPKELTEFGYLTEEGGEWVLRLNGIMSLHKGTLVLGAGGKPVRIRGRGVLAVPSLQIDARIFKSDPAFDLAVFYVFKDGVKVTTSDLVQAGIIVVNQQGSGQMRAEKPLKLEGALIADNLGSTSWGDGDHTISYDDSMKPTADIYCVSLSPLVTFQRITENEAL
ncbi:MAG: hypothetical protein WA705_05445 [Candidatus Ozemobacteraceae bacterium]